MYLFEHQKWERSWYTQVAPTLLESLNVVIVHISVRSNPKLHYFFVRSNVCRNGVSERRFILFFKNKIAGERLCKCEPMHRLGKPDRCECLFLDKSNLDQRIQYATPPDLKVHSLAKFSWKGKCNAVYDVLVAQAPDPLILRIKVFKKMACWMVQLPLIIHTVVDVLRINA